MDINRTVIEGLNNFGRIPVRECELCIRFDWETNKKLPQSVLDKAGAKELLEKFSPLLVRDAKIPKLGIGFERSEDKCWHITPKIEATSISIAGYAYKQLLNRFYRNQFDENGMLQNIIVARATILLQAFDTPVFGQEVKEEATTHTGFDKEMDADNWNIQQIHVTAATKHMPEHDLPLLKDGVAYPIIAAINKAHGSKSSIATPNTTNFLSTTPPPESKVDLALATLEGVSVSNLKYSYDGKTTAASRVTMDITYNNVITYNWLNPTMNDYMTNDDKYQI